jgi:hypothetical protein
MNSTISTPFLSQRTVPVSFTANNICLNFFGLFGECLYIHCFDCSLVSTFTNETQVSSSVTRMMWMRKLWRSLWYRSKKIKPKSFSAFYPYPSEFSEPILCKTCDWLTCHHLIGNRAWNLWNFTRNFWYCEAPSFANFLFSTLNKIATHYRWPADRLAIYREYLFAHPWTFKSIVLQFLHSLHFCRIPPHIIHDGFKQHLYL